MPRDPKQKVHKDFNEGIYHRPPTGPSFFTIGVFTAIVLVVLSLLRLRQGAAVRLRIQGHRDLPEPGDPADRPRRSGSPASTSAR